MTTRTWDGSLHPVALFAVVALGLALGGPAALAQSIQASGAATKQSGSAEVLVQAPRHQTRSYGIPPFAAEAAKEEAWRKYRDSAPPPGPCLGRPGAAQPADCGTFEGLKDYPGLQSLLAP
ncbi:MAG TPA: hypothetical protein VN814_17080 [Caulobacteraceae bacterium]|nr:hypothetical protein [Caulobacteraceae bacterium]